MYPTYCTVEQFKLAAGFKGPDKDSAISRLLASTSRQIERLLHRHFFPLVATRAYEWPQPFANTSLRLYLDADLLDIESVTSGGEPMLDYVPQPVNSPPYSRLEVNLASNDSFQQDATRQLSILIEGIWGYSQDTAVVGDLVAAIDDAVTALVVPDASLVGIGDLIFIDDEAMLVTGRAAVANASLLSADVGANAADTLIPVDEGTTFYSSEIILVDAEEMFIVAVAGNNLIVKRAYNGTALAAHLTDAIVYIERQLAVVRGACGTTATAHAKETPITRNVPPGLISDLCLAEAISRFEQEQAGYGRNIGQGEGAIEAKGVGLKDLRQQATDAYYRSRAVRSI